MSNPFKKNQQLSLDKITTRFKHLRGKHDQLDHAWNRGMGRGGGGVGLAPNQIGPLPTADFYRQRRIELMDQQRQGTITRAEMRRQMRDLRGITIDALDSVNENEMTLANANPNAQNNISFFDENRPNITPNSRAAAITAKEIIYQYLAKVNLNSIEELNKDDWKKILQEFTRSNLDKAKDVYGHYFDIFQKKSQANAQLVIDPTFLIQNNAHNLENLNVAGIAQAITNNINSRFFKVSPEFYTSRHWKEVVDALNAARTNMQSGYGQFVIDHYQRLYEEKLKQESSYQIQKTNNSPILGVNEVSAFQDKIYANMAEDIINKYMRKDQLSANDFNTELQNLDAGEIKYILDQLQKKDALRFAPAVFMYYEDLYNKKIKELKDKNYPGLSQTPKNFTDGRISADTFIEQSDMLGIQLQAELDKLSSDYALGTETKIWNDQQKEAYYKALENGYDRRFYANYAEWMQQANYTEKIMQQMGVSPSDALKVLDVLTYVVGKGLDVDSHLNALRIFKLQELQRKRGAAVSKMTDAEQDAAYNKLMNRIKQRYGRKTNIEYTELVNDCESVMALSLYANPDLRLRAIQDVDQNKLPAFQRKRRYKIESDLSNLSPDVQEIHDVFDIPSAIKYYSLEYRLLKAMQQELIDQNIVYTNYPKTEQQFFMTNFIYTHTSQTTTNILGAAIQTAVSQIGPNKAVGNIPSMYPPGVVPPKVHPKILQYLQQQYEETQARYKAAKQSDIFLFRGSKGGPARGIPMAPWSIDRATSQVFATAYVPSYLNRGNMPVQYIFLDYTDPFFVTNFTNEQEFLILESAALQHSSGTASGNPEAKRDSLYGLFDWKIKQLLDRSKKRIDIFEKTEGIVDNQVVSLYEPQYDIFYNFKKPMIKKSLLDRVNALRSK